MGRDLRVGMVGLGTQGAPVAARVLKAGFPLTLWARRAESLRPFEGMAEVAPSLAELGRVSDVVCVCVFSDTDVEEVVGGPGGLLDGMRPGSIVAIHSTVGPDTCRAMAELGRTRSVQVLDAPVSGSVAAAELGNLLVMVGGDEEDVERARPVFESFGDPVVRVGPVGSGQVVKLINNLVLSANFSVLLDAVAMAEGLCIAPELLLELLRHGTGASRAIDLLPVGEPLHSLGERVRPLLGKDAEIAFSVARAAGAPLGQLERVVSRLWAPDHMIAPDQTIGRLLASDHPSESPGR